MSRSDDAPPAGSHDWRELMVEAIDRATELRADLVSEVHDLRMETINEVQREFDHLADLHRAEQQLTRTHVLSQVEKLLDQFRALGSRLESRVTTVVLIAQLVTAALVVALVVYLS